MSKRTKDKLAEALRAVGLKDMADRAATGWYDDWVSPLDMPLTTLVGDLAVAATKAMDRDAVMALRKRVIDGDFDGTKEESDAWAASPEGQETFKHLLRK